MLTTMRIFLQQRNHSAIWALLAVAVLATAAWQLHGLGRTWLCPCGTVKLWHGTVLSPENSQHLTDWYTFSHIIHGFIFYALLHLANRWGGLNLSLSLRLLLAIMLESGWELAENAPAMIERYRQTALAIGYNGDSIINSLADILAMVAGFLLATRRSARTVIVLALVMELTVGWVIRDNLTLNVINLIHPLPAIQQWQQGA